MSLNPEYFSPSQGPREVSPEELAEADRQWQEAFDRGDKAYQEFLAQTDYFFSPAEVSFGLGISTETLEELREGKKLFAFQKDGESNQQYPRYQFIQNEDAVQRAAILPRLGDVLPLVPVQEPIAIHNFLTNEHPFLHGKSPIDILREEDESVVARLRVYASEVYGEMGS